MTPVFFPFTHVTCSQLKILETFFPCTSFLGTQQTGQEPVHVKTALTAQNLQRIELDENALRQAEQKTSEYLEWAKIHKGNEHNLKAILTENPYFTSDTHVHTIKSQIKNSSSQAQQKVRPGSKDSQLESLLFLTLAQACDAQNEQIDSALVNVDASSKQLIADLQGEPDGFSDQALFSNTKTNLKSDYGRILTSRRVTAWFDCFKNVSNWNKNKSENLFITTSSAVMEWLESKSLDLVNALDIDQIKVHENNCKRKNDWQKQVCKMLIAACQAEGRLEKKLPEIAGCCNLKGRMQLKLFSGGDLNQYLDLQGQPIAVCLVNLN